MSASENPSEGDLLLREVDDEMRHEQYVRLWKRYGNLIIGAALAVVLVVAGYQGWRSWQTRLRQEESGLFAAAQDMLAKGDKRGGLDVLAKLGNEGHAGLAVAARALRAEVLAADGDTGLAVATWEEIAASGAPPLFRDLAILKQALLTLDSADPAVIEGRVAPLAAADRPWHYAATEILAMAAGKKGDRQRAAELYKQLADDFKAPQGVRSRAADMLAGSQPPAPPLPPEKTKG